MRISTPNAAYKVSSLIRKGYLRKVQSQADRREYHLEVTQRYLDYYDVSSTYVEQVMSRITERFSSEECGRLESMLRIVSRELMPEVRLRSTAERMSKWQTRKRPSDLTVRGELRRVLWYRILSERIKHRVTFDRSMLYSYIAL